MAELERLGDKQSKSEKNRMNDLFWALALAFVGMLTVYYKDFFGWLGVAFALTLVTALYLGLENHKLKELNQKLTSDDAEKRRARELFLRQSINPNTIFGIDILIQEADYSYGKYLNEGDIIEFMVFSQKKFNFALLDDDNYQKLHANRDNGKIKINYSHLASLQISPMVIHKNITFVKMQFKVRVSCNHAFYFTRADDTDKEDFQINFIITKISPHPENKTRKGEIQKTLEGEEVRKGA